MLWRLRTLQQLSIKIKLSLRSAKVSVGAAERTKRGRECGYRDGSFVAAVSEMWFHLHFATRGDSSLYHLAVCCFVWSRSWPEGKKCLSFFPVACRRSPCITLHILCMHTVCFCMDSCVYVLMQMSTPICVYKWEAYSWAIRCQRLLFRLSEPDWISMIQIGFSLVLN